MTSSTSQVNELVPTSLSREYLLGYILQTVTTIKNECVFKIYEIRELRTTKCQLCV
jgi:hypothetical protein